LGTFLYCLFCLANSIFLYHNHLKINFNGNNQHREYDMHKQVLIEQKTRISGRYWFWLLRVVAVSVIPAQPIHAQPPSRARSAPVRIGQVPATEVLQRLGAKLEEGATPEQVDAYLSHFVRMDQDGDGKHSRAEYVDKGAYMTPQARAGIFRAADGNADGMVTKAEYVLNRIITDEAKAIVQAMDDDQDGLVERMEFIRHAAKLLSDHALAEQVYAALDANANGGIPIPEYLRVWGQWARAEQDPALSGPGRPSDGPPFGRPGGGFGPPSVSDIFERFDGNKDGRLQREEVPEFVRQFILAADANGDDVVTREELEVSRQGQRPERGPGNRASAGSERSGRFGAFAPEGIGPGQPGLGRLASSGLEIGKPFPLVRIVDAQGKAFSTGQLKGHYTVLVAGCLTCPAFLRSYPGVEALRRDYAGKGVKFHYVYRALAHPENNGIVRPFSLDERLMHVAEARKRLKTQVPWLADNMNNEFKRTIGNTNNSEFLLDPEGRIVHMQMWSSGERLRAALEAHVGKVDKPTSVADLGIPALRMQPNTRGTVLPRIEVPGIMVPLKIEPRQNRQPFYVKLRAEAEQSVLNQGNGKIYLGFHIDPIHHTHWNNLVDPLHFEIKAASGTKVTPDSGDGPKLDVASDSDPREFLINLENADSNALLNLTVRYFACSDDPAWCKALEQQYAIHLKRDEFGGAVFGRSFVPGGPPRGGSPRRGPSQRGSGPSLGGFGGQGPPAGRPGSGGPPNAEMFFTRFDRNGDGKLTEAEVPAGLWQRLRNADANDDGVLTAEELEKGRNRRFPD